MHPRPRRTKPFRAAIVVGIVASVGCGLDPGGAWNRTDGAGPGTGTSSGARPDDDAFQSFDATCPATSPRFPGTAGPGVVCTSASSECSPTCCACPAQPQTWLASSCVAGTCADGMTACARTQASNCSAGTPIVVFGGGGGATTTQSACDACIRTSCAAAQQACTVNAACVSLESCDAQCATDEACRTRCYDTHALGVADLQNLDVCVESACGDACVP